MNVSMFFTHLFMSQKSVIMGAVSYSMELYHTLAKSLAFLLSKMDFNKYLNKNR